MKFNSKKIAAVCIAGLALISTACNTIEGVGKDLESAGDKAQEVTKKN